MCTAIRVLLLACMPVVGGAAEAGGKIQQTTLQECLAMLGARLDCYFTVESVGRPGNHENPILDGFIHADASGVRDVDGALSFLANEVEVVWVDSGATNHIHLVAGRFGGNANIIMIRDERLAGVANYALTNKVTVACEQSPSRLLDILSAKEPLIKDHDPFGLGDQSSCHDNATQIDVCATNESIRAVLATCVPLERYSRVIWSADTDGKNDSPEIRVEFYGQRPKQPFKDCLLDLGDRLDCYFTVEGVSPYANLWKHIDSEFSRLGTVDEVLSSLTNGLGIVWPESKKGDKITFVAEEFGGDSRIIRIRDKGLMDIEHDVLGNSVSVEYEGTPSGLIELLSSRDTMIQQSKRSTLRAVLHGYVCQDPSTKIHVSATNAPVRDVLTSCIPLDGYSRIIWSSYHADKEDGLKSIAVNYYGKARDRSKPLEIRWVKDPRLRRKGDAHK
ncbi:MAG: hypothetical protein MI921_13080 [Cytophagales bacterium]|nr:hypothetical protein [Cytophagales bacterium]